MRLPRRVLSPEFIAVWRAYEAANRKAADMYATSTPPGTRPASRPCPRCGKKTRARTTDCRACVARKGKK